MVSNASLDATAAVNQIVLGSPTDTIHLGQRRSTTNALHRLVYHVRGSDLTGSCEGHPDVHRGERDAYAAVIFPKHKWLTSIFVVGFGLTFGLNAAPLLITELAYPTQVSCYGAISRRQLIHGCAYSEANSRPCITHHGIWAA